MNISAPIFSILEKSHFLAGETHLWLLNLSDINESILTSAIKLLSADELQRAESFKRKKSEYILTRAFLRNSLARYCGHSPEQLIFATHKNGKPYLTNVSIPLFFNLSHSGDFAIVAISAQQCIGVDIEVVRKRHYMKIAEHYFHPQEIKQLTACREEDQTDFFLQLWTLKEAFLKALGGGIALGLDKIQLDLSQQPMRVAFADSLNEQEDHWQFFSSRINPQTFISVASAQQRPLQIRWLNGLELFRSKTVL